MKPRVGWDSAVAVITGASRGIGRAVAIAAARRGASVGLIARSRADLEDTLTASGGRGALVTADVSNPDEVAAAFSELVASLGEVDILVNNAGIGAYGCLTELPADTAERLVRVNYLGTVYPTLAVLPSMYARGRGHVVNVASVAGRMGAPLEAAYCASKFAVVGFSEALAAEAAARGVVVSLINPGPVATDFFSARGVPYARRRPRPIPPERVAQAVLRAVDRGRAEQHVPRWLGAAYVVKTALPALYRAAVHRDARRAVHASVGDARPEMSADEPPQAPPSD